MRSLKKKEISEAYSAYFTKGLYLSEAFRDLKPAARDIFFLLALEIRFAADRKKKSFGKTAKRSRRQITNRDSIVLPYQQIIDQLGYSRPTISAAFKEFIEHGFVEVVKHGGGSKNDYNVYRICEDWQNWKPGNVVRTRPERMRKIGFQRKNKVKQSSHRPVKQSLHREKISG